ncbi:MAG: hypothetical protein PUG33_05105 [Mollicutes bacterium]|nr:hypothetical protein [Mollicutes bacterium]
MMVDKIDLLDNDYNLVSRKASPRQIKTRSKSFSSISGIFTKFRISRLEKKLEKSRKSFVNQEIHKNLGDSSVVRKTEKNIEKKAKAIAKIEEKIMILSKENVPTNYVENRAIKLRKNMMSNLSHNSSMAYSLGIKTEADEAKAIDKIFNEDSPLSINERVRESELEDVEDVEEQENDQVETPESIMSHESEEIGRSVSSILAGDTSKEFKVADDKETDAVEKEEVSSDESDKEVSEPVSESEQIPDISTFMKDIDLNINTYQDSTNTNSVIDENESREHIEVVPTDIDRDAIKSSIDDQFENIAKSGDVSEEETITNAGRPNAENRFNSIDNGVKFVSPETVKGVVGTGSKIDIDTDEPKSISPEEVRAVLDGKFDEVENTEEEDKVDTHLDVKSIEETISDALNKLDEEEHNKDLDDEMSFEDVHEEVEDAINERNKISSNESHVARINEFDADGNKKQKFDYVPMTDEEIKQAQENIEYEKYENPAFKEEKHLPKDLKFNYPKIRFEDIFVPANKDVDYKIESEDVVEEEKQEIVPVNDNIRGEIVVVPDRKVQLPMVVEDNKEDEQVVTSEDVQDVEEEPIEDYTFDTSKDDEKSVSNEEEDLSFDFSNASANEIDCIIDKLGTKSQFDALKARVEQLRKQQIEQRKREEEARKAAEDAARKAEEQKKRYNESMEKNNQYLELLKSYAEALEEDNERTKQRTQAFEETKEMENRFAEDQRVKAEQALAMVDEINSIIGPVAENVSVVKR